MVASETIDHKPGAASVTFHIRNPSLWYPIRYGKQPLYTIKATLLKGDGEIDSASKKIGLRRAALVQRPLKEQPGTSFFFEVNNIPSTAEAATGSPRTTSSRASPENGTMTG